MRPELEAQLKKSIEQFCEALGSDAIEIAKSYAVALNDADAQWRQKFPDKLARFHKAISIRGAMRNLYPRFPRRGAPRAKVSASAVLKRGGPVASGSAVATVPPPNAGRGILRCQAASSLPGSTSSAFWKSYAVGSNFGAVTPTRAGAFFGSPGCWPRRRGPHERLGRPGPWSK